jgi:hypothetical protein
MYPQVGILDPPREPLRSFEILEQSAPTAAGIRPTLGVVRPGGLRYTAVRTAKGHR